MSFSLYLQNNFWTSWIYFEIDTYLYIKFLVIIWSSLTFIIFPHVPTKKWCTFNFCTVYLLLFLWSLSKTIKFQNFCWWKHEYKDVLLVCSVFFFCLNVHTWNRYMAKESLKLYSITEQISKIQTNTRPMQKYFEHNNSEYILIIILNLRKNEYLLCMIANVQHKINSETAELVTEKFYIMG